MKRIAVSLAALLRGLLLCFAAVFMLAACAADEAPSSDTSPPSQASEPEPAESETASATEESVPPFAEGVVGDVNATYESLEETGLSEEQVELYWNARSAYLENMGPGWIDTDFLYIGFPYGDNDRPTVERDGIYYYLLDGEFSTLQEITDWFYSLFTPEYADELMGVGTNFVRYIEVDGQLYGCYGDRGTHIDWTGEPDLFGPAITYLGEGVEGGRVEFEVIGRYEDRETGEAYTEGYPIVMVNTGDGWRVDEFNLTY